MFAILGKEPIEPDKMLYIPGCLGKKPVDLFPVRPIGQNLLRVLIIEQRVAVDVRQSHIVHIHVLWRLGKRVSNRFHGVHLIQCRLVLYSFAISSNQKVSISEVQSSVFNRCLYSLRLGFFLSAMMRNMRAIVYSVGFLFSDATNSSS